MKQGCDRTQRIAVAAVSMKFMLSERMEKGRMKHKDDNYKKSMRETEQSDNTNRPSKKS